MLKIVHIEAIEAAIYRTNPKITPLEYLVEFVCSCIELQPDSRGHLRWKSSTLGRKLFIRISEAQNWRCCYCGVRTTTRGDNRVPNYATFEHILPKCWSGDEHPDNLVMACVTCNSKRGTRMSNGNYSTELRRQLLVA